MSESEGICVDVFPCVVLLSFLYIGSLNPHPETSNIIDNNTADVLINFLFIVSSIENKIQMPSKFSASESYQGNLNIFSTAGNFYSDFCTNFIVVFNGKSTSVLLTQKVTNIKSKTKMSSLFAVVSSIVRLYR